MATKFSELNPATRNSMVDHYNGANPASIKMALQMKPAERKELEEFFDTTDIDTIALRLSMGNYEKD